MRGARNAGALRYACPGGNILQGKSGQGTMKRWCAWVLLLWCAVGAAWANEVEHKRGDFSFFTGPAPAFVKPHAIADRWDPKAPGATDAVWRFWLFDEQIDRRKGVASRYVDYVYESLTAAHLGEAGKHTIEFNPEYQRLVLHKVELRRDGKWLDRLLPDKISLARRETDFEQDLADGQVSALIVLDDVRVGDVVRINYTITGGNPILAGHGWDSAVTAWGSPAHDVHERVLYDAGTKVRFHLRNGAAAPVVRETPDGVEVVVDAHASAPIVDEGNYPTWYAPTPRVQFGPARSWGDVAAWAIPLYPATDVLPADLEARIVEWKKLQDPNLRLRAALRAVQDEVRYFGVEMGSNTHRPNAPADTWNRRYGDCKDKTYLLVTILRKLDVAAVPALVSTELGRGLRDIEPTAAAFNHVIVRATPGKDVVWVDPTMTHQGGDPRMLDLSDLGAGLPITVGATALETIPAPKTISDGVATLEDFTPDGKDGGLRLEVETTYRGAAANNARRVIAGSRPDELQRRYAEYYRQRFGELDVATAPKFSDDRDANTLKISETYVLKAPFQTEGSQGRGLDIFAEALDSATKLPARTSRTGPLDIGRTAEYRQEIRLAAPQGWRSTIGNEDAEFTSPAFDYKRSVEREGDNVRVVYELKVKAREIDGKGAGAHLAELRRVRENLSARLRFQSPGAPIDASERDKRLKALLRGSIGGDTGTQ